MKVCELCGVSEFLIVSPVPVDEKDTARRLCFECAGRLYVAMCRERVHGR